MAVSLALALSCVAWRASADDSASSAEASGAIEPSDEPTAADVATAPRPQEDSSGIEGGQEGVPGYLWVPRLLLYPVRGALEVGMAPLRGLIFVEQKYALRDRLKAFFFTDDERYGMYPTALVETGFGLNVGARVVAKQPFYWPMDLKLRAGYGGQYQSLFEGKLDIVAGKHLSFAGEALWEIRPRDRFYGIGNLVPTAFSELAMTGLDAVYDETAVKTRFSEELVQVGVRTSVLVPRPFGLAVENFFIHRRFGPNEGAAFGLGIDEISIEDVYDTATVPGFDDGVDYVYSELELTLDTRRTTSPFSSDPMPGTGWYLEVYGGIAETVRDDLTSFMRYGFDLQRYLRIAQNPRTLVLRAHLEGVTGELEDVPFTELPRLGGPVVLRGYRRDRFRDRLRALATAEYQWDLSESFAGFVFVDAGKVMRDYDELDANDLRVGFGGGLQMHSRTSYIGRLQAGTSIDGGVIFQVSFDPAFDIESRTLRK